MRCRCFFPQGDPTYLVVKPDGKLENYGINAVCTHLGCVVPWNNVGVFPFWMGDVGAVERDGGCRVPVYGLRCLHGLWLACLDRHGVALSPAGREQVQVPLPRLPVQRRGQGGSRPRPSGESHASTWGAHGTLCC